MAETPEKTNGDSQIYEAAAPDAPEDENDEPEISSKFAKKVVNELYERYNTLRERRSAYKNLFFFLCFVTFNLSILYLQRDAESAYAVVSTISRSGVIPEDTETSKVDDILDWLEGTLQTHWKDPVCGDDKCEEPFEFAFYGRFGCRADCGQFRDKMNITAVQIDLYYDFGHAPGSTPATALMGDSFWNLCPAADSSFFDTYFKSVNTSKIKHGSACYYEEFQAFDQLVGHVQDIIPDVPDGEWELVIRGDLFNKVSGAIRHRDNVTLTATDLKVQAAEAITYRRMNAELNELSEVSKMMAVSDKEIVSDRMFEIYTYSVLALNESLTANNLNQSDWILAEQYLSEQYDLSVRAIEQKVDTTCAAQKLKNMTMVGAIDNSTGLVYCGECFNPLEYPEPFLWEYENATVGEFFDQCNCASTVDYLCEVTAAVVEEYRGNITERLLGLDELVEAAGTTLWSQFEEGLKINHTALVYEINGATGDDVTEVQLVSIWEMAKSMLELANEGLKFQEGLRKYSITKVEFDELRQVVNSRVAELTERQASNLEGKPAPMKQIYQHLDAEADGPVFAMDFIMDHMAGVNYTYNYWRGGASEYMTCEMSSKGKVKYRGMCFPDSNADDLANTEVSQGLVIYAPEVLEQCEALCVCEEYFSEGLPTRACPSAHTCMCEACGFTDDMQKEYLNSLKRRILLQVNGGDGSDPVQTYQELLTAIQALSGQQTALSSQVSLVQTEQERQNAAAEAHHADKTLENTINAGFSELQGSYKVLQGQMDVLLAKQDQVLKQQEAALAQQSKILALEQQQLAAQKKIAKAVEQQLKDINAALEKGVINKEEKRKFRIKTLLSQLKLEKQSEFANLPCDLKPKYKRFDIDRYEETIPDEARQRLIGINNKVVAGMLMYSTRNKFDKCNNTRFEKIESKCITGLATDLQGFGVDPVFKLLTPLYDADLAYPETMTQYYDCNLETTATYTEDNPYPYCTELYNTQLRPYGFFQWDLQGYEDGFPVFFDINLSELRAAQWFDYVKHGHYIDDSETRDLQVQMVTYNAELRTFANIKITFEFLTAGKIEISHSIQAIRVELYETTNDLIRMAMEIILACLSVAALIIELTELVDSHKKYGTVKAYFRSAWNYLDLLSIAIMIACCITWWTFVLKFADPFKTSELPGGRLNVYGDLDAKARYLRLSEDIENPNNCPVDPTTGVPSLINPDTGEPSDCEFTRVRGNQMDEMSNMFAKMEKLGTTLSSYMTLSGINIIMMIVRSLKLMDFQPRLGIVTKTLTLAASDILHFMVVFGVVFMGYVMMGTLVFGYKIEAFSSLEKSVRTCFETLLGEIGWNADLQDLESLEKIAGFVYFWSYQILVFMILLNFLLAIIVDAYAEIKEAAHETVSVPAEVYPMMREKWRTLMKSKYLYKSHIPEERIRKSLKVLAGRGNEESDSDESIDYDPDPEKVLSVGDEEIDKETLNRVLQHCIAYAEEKSGVYDVSAKGQQGSNGILGACMPSGGNKNLPPLFSSEDVAGAVEMLLDQHGQVKEKEEGNEDEEEEEEDIDTKELMEKMAELVKGQQNLMSSQKKLEELEERLLKVIELPSAQPDSPKIPKDE
mmetsp:Transcript_39231/g.47511  ORF Transcript_39231/g.47511 Transcript_39231/m.47511 type:complete len:1596 (-) Transcript_39231:688-5475(-)|eukprot:CAMPEP_0197851944 /NCGR_PEP_ID=MMETSP1438-20131217/19279_1 /TAXON_ID=1461541 /ORGANISM="Pterosperma sp., Strain CCMP1384" /LENGTH=1595 /DNA_ID=CAMNT_0043465751 /DNA_START=331 /DNA_END=5118 /DNA_ORIENTATION=-